MAPFHFIFFGMMLSDAGYGLVLTILLYLVMKKVKPQGLGGQLVMVCLFGSISTIIWGHFWRLVWPGMASAAFCPYE